MQGVTCEVRKEGVRLALRPMLGERRVAASFFRLSGRVDGCATGLDEKHSRAGDVERVQDVCRLLHINDATRAGGLGRAHSRRSSSGVRQWLNRPRRGGR